MDWTQALMLGVIQGLTEFLPVSSSGHLVLGQRLLGLTEPHLLFDVAVHVGTLLAVVVVFADDLRLMAMGLVPGRDRDPGGRRLVILVAVGMVPAAIAGLLFRDAFEALYASTLAVGVALLLTGSMLMLTFLIPNGARNLERGGVPTAFVVGVAQAIAIIPGISRSGATISVGLALGLGRGSAARLSFLLGRRARNARGSSLVGRRSIGGDHRLLCAPAFGAGGAGGQDLPVCLLLLDSGRRFDRCLTGNLVTLH
jgi:undecaprenyl-diphosphatase